MCGLLALSSGSFGINLHSRMKYPSLFARGRVSPFGLLFVGLIGAVVGGFIFFDLLDFQPTGELAGGILIRWIDIIVSIIGALIVMAFTSVFYWRRL